MIDVSTGGLAAVLAHPDDESFGVAGALALAHDAGHRTRLLLATRGEAGGQPDADPELIAGTRRDELRCAAAAIGLDEVTLLEGYPDGGVADESFEGLVGEIMAWLSTRRPDAVVTFGPHGVTGHPDHVVVGSATRWAVERLARIGQAPAFVYVISPVFGPVAERFDLSAEEQAVTHRVDVSAVADRKLRALECHASQPDTLAPIAQLRADIGRRRPVYEGYHRVLPEVQPPMVAFAPSLL